MALGTAQLPGSGGSERAAQKQKHQNQRAEKQAKTTKSEVVLYITQCTGGDTTAPLYFIVLLFFLVFVSLFLTFVIFRVGNILVGVVSLLFSFPLYLHTANITQSRTYTQHSSNGAAPTTIAKHTQG